MIYTKEISIERQADVLVVGGGPAGACAAIAAARGGASVILVEAQPSLGGMATQRTKLTSLKYHSTSVFSPGTLKASAK